MPSSAESARDVLPSALANPSFSDRLRRFSDARGCSPRSLAARSVSHIERAARDVAASAAALAVDLASGRTQWRAGRALSRARTAVGSSPSP